MKKEQFAFLVVGFAFGILVGFGAYSSVANLPGLDDPSEAAGRAGGPARPPANSQTAADAGAPMMAEIRGLKKRVQDDPEDHAALVRLANLYHDGNMLDDAIGYYELALKLKPDSPDQLTDLGICFRGKQEFERALKLFEQANAVDPNHWQSLFNYVVVAGFDLKRFDAANEALDTMEKISPRPPQLDDLRKALLQEAESKPASSG